MSETISKKNGEQDIKIAELRQWKEDFSKTFDDFVSNHFAHLKKKVDMLFWLILAGIATPILLFIIRITIE